MSQASETAARVIGVVALATDLFLSVFFLVQAFLDRNRRWKWALFGTSWLYLAAVEMAGGSGLIPLRDYEALRMVWGGGYLASLLLLFGASSVFSVVAVSVIAASALVTWQIDWTWASTVSFPMIFAVGGWLHFTHWRLSGGFGSAMLAGCSIMLAVMCTCFRWAVETGPTAQLLGWCHYAAVSVAMVVFGWIHFPRELRERSPVLMGRREMTGFIAFCLVVETGQLAALLGRSEPLVPWGAFQIVGLLGVLTVFFRHRHRLVIYAANVTDLLDERTRSLQEAREQLAHHNETLEVRLADQAKELKSRAAVIQRQKRLELAAQTAGETAHDMQNLISPIIYRLRQLESSLPGDTAATDEVAKIRKHLDGVIDLNSQILTLARRGATDDEDVSISGLVDEVVQQFPGEGIVVDVSEDCWTRLSWKQIVRALSNIVRNGLEAAPESPLHIEVNTETMLVGRGAYLGWIGPGDWCVIRVRDRGPGIDEETRERMFDPFFSTKSTEIRSGSGLGLSIVAAVLDDCGGALDVVTGESGSEFQLYLPRVEHAGRVVRPDQGTVLTVALDGADVSDTERALESAGWDVLTASGIEAAVRICQSTDVEAFVTVPDDSATTDLVLRKLVQVRPAIRPLHFQHA